MPEPITPTITLHEDDIDALLYFSRAGDLADLQEALTTLSSTHQTSEIYILAAAVDPNTGNTPLHYACANGHNEVITLILSLVTQTRDTDIALSVLARSNDAGNTPLHYAAMNGQLAAVKALLVAVAAVGAEEDGARDKAQLLAQKNNAGHDAAYEAESNGKDDVVQYLLGVMDEADEAGAGAEAPREDGDEVDEEVEGGNLDRARAKDSAATIEVEQAQERIADMKMDGEKG